MEALLFRLIQESYLTGIHFSSRFGGDYLTGYLTFSQKNIGVNAGWESLSKVEIYEDWESKGEIVPWDSWASTFYKFNINFYRFRIIAVPEVGIVYDNIFDTSLGSFFDGVVILGKSLSNDLYIYGAFSPPTLILNLYPEFDFQRRNVMGCHGAFASAVVMYNMNTSTLGTAVSYNGGASPLLRLAPFLEFKDTLIIISLLVSPVSIWLENSIEFRLYSFKNYEAFLKGEIEFHPLGTGFALGINLVEK